MFYRVTAICLIFIYACNFKNKQVTFAEDIAPIIYKNCTKCHVNGEAGPFNLVTYQDIASKAKLIAYVTQNRIMPPWPAEASYTSFANQTVLSTYEIEIIKSWIYAGMQPGDTANLKPFVAKQKQKLGKPDLVLKLPYPINIEGNNTDKFLVVKIPYQIAKDTFVKAIEFVPGNKKLVHHMNAHLIQFNKGKKKNIYEGSYWVNQDQANSQTIHKQLGLLHDDGT